MMHATVQRDFWGRRLEVNAQRAIFHQWEQLEASGCIENFRIAAGQSGGLREGWFFADSDAYRWLDAASRIWAHYPDERLEALMEDLIRLLAAAQAPDGYLFTYNQIHFPDMRWQNLQIEHELYCNGHLIEAGVSHYEATGRKDLLNIAQRAADRIVADFRGKSGSYTPGHEEIEIALLRLHAVLPGDSSYLEMARQFLEQRGRVPRFAFSIVRQFMDTGKRSKLVRQMRQAYLDAHPDFRPFVLPAGNAAKRPGNATLRWYLSALSGKYFQQHAPIREHTVPVGHSVRFSYLETAVAMLRRAGGDGSLLPALEAAWERMVTRRMYVTGGIGSLPGMEGFGKDYELDPEYAYAETCAAIGSLLWNWQMAQLTGEAKYSDLFEWQLYNAAAVGMSLDGATYLYNNPLACRGGMTRQPWYAIPCCPSNLSRAWADLGKVIFSSAPGRLYIHQYISSELSDAIIPCDDGSYVSISLEMQASLPWEGRVLLRIKELAWSNPSAHPEFELHLRQPSWATGMHLAINGKHVADPFTYINAEDTTASGYDPRLSVFTVYSHKWSPGDEIEAGYDMPVRLLRPHARLKGHSGKVAVRRGPLVYCLEGVDHAGLDIFSARLDPDSLASVFDGSLLDGITRIDGRTTDGKPLIFIPYFLWGNRGPSQMTVWVNT